jgi:hypothetical protein
MKLNRKFRISRGTIVVLNIPLRISASDEASQALRHGLITLSLRANTDVLIQIGDGGSVA